MKPLYVDTSALLKRYVSETFSKQSSEIIAKFENIFTSQITITETLINLRKRLSKSEFAIAAKLFKEDIRTFNVISIDEKLSYEASEVADGNSLATLDALHIASALRFKGANISFLTYDKTQAVIAAKKGLAVLGG